MLSYIASKQHSSGTLPSALVPFLCLSYGHAIDSMYVTSNSYLRSTPDPHGVWEVGPMMRTWAGILVAVSLWLVFFKKEVSKRAAI